MAVSLSVANQHASLPIAYRLYLPPGWAEDGGRRAKAGIPDEIGFATKTAIALAQMRQALADHVPVGIVRAAPAYANETAFRTGGRELGLRYALGVPSSTTVWPPGTAPLLPRPEVPRRRARPQSRLQHAADQQPVSLKDLAVDWPKHAWRTVTWRTVTWREREAKVHCPHAWPPDASDPPIVTPCAQSPGRKNGCPSNGPRVRRSRPSTGCPTCRPPPPSSAWFIPPRGAG